MTDEMRLDLRALDLVVSDERREAILSSVHAQRGAIGKLLRVRRRAVAVAAALAGLAAATMLLLPRQGTAQSDQVLLDWVQQSHVPSNAELLAAFHGYQR